MDTSNIDIPTLIALSAVVVAVIIAIITVGNATKSFKRTTTLQTEIFILGAYKDYMDIMYSKTSDAHKNNARTRFLMAIDLYCKYVMNGHLDEKLSKDNLHFYEECIKAFKDTIKENIKEAQLKLK